MSPKQVGRDPDSDQDQTETSIRARCSEQFKAALEAWVRKKDTDISKAVRRAVREMIERDP